MQANEAVGVEYTYAAKKLGMSLAGEQDYKCYHVDEATYLVNELDQVYNPITGF